MSILWGDKLAYFEYMLYVFDSIQILCLQKVVLKKYFFILYHNFFIIYNNNMTILVTAGAVIINENKKILLVLRPTDKKVFPDCRALPGWKVDAGESLKDTVIREIKEESWLYFSPTEKYTFTEYISDDSHNISHLFFWKSDWNLLPETKAMWYSYNELSTIKLAFDQHIVFDDLHKKWLLS